MEIYRKINTASENTRGLVVYWISRDQRLYFNRALNYASKLACERKEPLIVLFALQKNFLNAQPRHFQFMLSGLYELEQEAKTLNINFIIKEGHPSDIFFELNKAHTISHIVTDFSPLKIKDEWYLDLKKKLPRVPITEIDAHNIVPAWITSSKQEYSARTIRPKIISQLDNFPIDRLPLVTKRLSARISSDTALELYKSFHIGRFVSGRKTALNTLSTFITTKLKNYDQHNNPNAASVSDLSVYLHFGQISSYEIYMQLKNNKDKNVKMFLEELIVRKELSDNFCLYNKDYDNYKSIPAWGLRTLNKHITDKRDYIYNLATFERAQTHDSLWNAAQFEMVNIGKMHGYLRMYWAKKILEWSSDYKQAVEIACYLNDKYSLDGRDPNGYAGILWAIGGLHDRPWRERSIFGNIRYMNLEGCKRKFNIEEYINRVDIEKER